MPSLSFDTTIRGTVTNSIMEDCYLAVSSVEVSRCQVFKERTRFENRTQVWTTQNAKQFTPHAIFGKCSVGDKSKSAKNGVNASQARLTGKRTHAARTRHARTRHARGTHASARMHARDPRRTRSRDPERAAGHNALRVRCILRIPTPSGSAAYLIDGEALRRWRLMPGDS